MKNLITRRSFVNGAAKMGIASAGFSTLGPFFKEGQDPTDVGEINIVGPKKGFTPHIGVLMSMMNWMRETMLNTSRGLSVTELDYLHDEESNSIGAMLLHLAATERFYQLNTFDNKRWGNWPKEDREEFGVGMSLGKAGRKEIKGNSLDFYLEKLERVRNHTIEEFKKRDDEWLLSVDKKWGWGPTNNYCKWFHVCEHESNHNGQMKYIKSRIQV